MIFGVFALLLFSTTLNAQKNKQPVKKITATISFRYSVGPLVVHQQKAEVAFEKDGKTLKSLTTESLILLWDDDAQTFVLDSYNFNGETGSDLNIRAKEELDYSTDSTPSLMYHFNNASLMLFIYLNRD